ncbi:hypothetical protein C4572_01200 [Candidatus Parcubacteria bacterium]|nr:MAG: hypothetical protein C4572_01200 [Candidatus Parcubacteria bacterium]
MVRDRFFDVSFYNLFPKLLGRICRGSGDRFSLLFARTKFPVCLRSIFRIGIDFGFLIPNFERQDFYSGKVKNVLYNKVMFWRKRKRFQIDPDEIFLDSSNVSGFDKSQFEGRLEKPIGKATYIYVSGAIGLITLFFLGRIFLLQVAGGEKFAQRSERNTLKKERIAPLRGVIYDRNGVILAWNSEDGRSYADMPGLSHVLGYTGLASKEEMDKNSHLFTDEMIGKEGIEESYNDLLRGMDGVKLIEKDSFGNIISENAQTSPTSGKNLILTIDAETQSQLYKYMSAVIKDRGFQGGAAVILDVKDGGILAMANFPEYNSNVLSKGGPADKIKGFISDPQKPFINRAISGLYAPGSVIKPFVALAALAEGVVSPDKQIYSSGSISLPNPFFPDKKTVFKDWKAHGWVNMKKAIALSSDVYFYEVGGGFEDLKGLGINKIHEYAKKFGLGEKTGIDIPGEAKGVVPSPEVKARNNPDDPIWRVGDTYISSIGQGYFLSTPIEIAAYVAALVNDGKTVTPHLAENDRLPVGNDALDVSKEHFKIVKEGMRMTVTEGTAQGLSYPDLRIAAKTGTAEVGGKKDFIHSWLVGFYPYEDPKYAFAIVLEKGHAGNTTGAPYVMKQFFDWLKINKPEYAGLERRE